jgi:hypothetical protein
MNELQVGAAALGREFKSLTPFASAARQSLINLGASAAESQPSLIATEPLAQRLLKLGNATLPAATSLDQLTSSLDQTGGLEFLMSFLYNGANAGNGFDASGHFLRTQLQAGTCTGFAATPVPGCSANFLNGASAAADAGAGQAAQVATAVARRHARHGRHGRRAQAQQPAATASASTGSAQPAAGWSTGANRFTSTLKGLLSYLIGSGR